MLNPVVMSHTANVNPLLVLLSLLIGTSIGGWLGGTFGSFVAALLSSPVAGALHVRTWAEHDVVLDAAWRAMGVRAAGRSSPLSA